jgi:diguanylate cyclase (GGDEF)-like protein/PAS domain S-box-containing protein
VTSPEQPRQPRSGVPALSEALVAATTALVCVVDADGRMLLANPSLQRFTGRSEAELLGQRFWEVYIVPEHVALAQDALARSIDTGVAHPQEGDWLGAGGLRRRVAMQNDVLLDAAGVPYAVGCIGFDVTAEREREAQLHQRARTDLLTGVLNRSALFEALSVHLDPETGRGCGVLFCDLDQFKLVNDEHGHAAGDRLLIEVAARLQALAGGTDLVARFGGDEFVLVCPAGGPGRLADLAEIVLEQVSRPFPGPAGELSVGVSIGVATGRAGEAPDELIARADRAMYGAKSSRHTRRGPRQAAPDD